MFVEKYKQALAVLTKKPVMLWGLSLLSTVIMAIAAIVTSPIMILSFAATTLLGCGMIKVYLDGLKGKEVNSDQLFSAFNKNWLRIVGGMAWQTLWIIIWGLIPVVGIVFAVIKSYSYAFVPYILMTKPEVTATQALKLSMQMTEGKKGQMFLADFCFGLIIYAAAFVLGLFAAIPIIGIIFALVLLAFMVVVALFSTIFVGLYKAAFYVDSAEEKAPVVEEIPAPIAE